jgi:hypothetical protein
LTIRCDRIQCYKETKDYRKYGIENKEQNNKITMDFILEGLLDLVREKVGKQSQAKELLDKIHNIYSMESHYTVEMEHAN